MDDQDKWDYIVALDDELLLGDALVSEWSAFLIRNADMAFVGDAPLASIITAMAGIESHLKDPPTRDRRRLVKLIDESGLEADLIKELHTLRQYRNKWVHVQVPGDDQALLEHPEDYEAELEKMGKRAIRALRRVIYAWQGIRPMTCLPLASGAPARHAP